MSTKDEIERIKGNVTDALSAAAEMGADVPEGANSNSLGSLIRAIPRLNVVQSTGESTTDVMSQAAVTDALAHQAPFYVTTNDITILTGEGEVQTDAAYEQVLEAYTSGRPVYFKIALSAEGEGDLHLIAPLASLAYGEALFALQTPGTVVLQITMAAGAGNAAKALQVDIIEQSGIRSELTAMNAKINTNVAGSGIDIIKRLTQAEYDAMPSHSEYVLYVIVG